MICLRWLFGGHIDLGFDVLVHELCLRHGYVQLDLVVCLVSGEVGPEGSVC